MFFVEYPKYNIHYDLAAMVLTAFMLVVYLLRRGYKTKTHAVLFAMFVCNLISSAADTIGSYLVTDPSLAPISLNYLFNMIYLFAHNFSACLFMLYTLITVKEFEISEKDHILWIAVAIFEAMVIFTTPLTHLVFYFTDEKLYTHGIMIYALYAITFIMILISIGIFIKYRNKLTKSQLITNILYLVMIVIAVIIQYFSQRYLIENFVCITAYLTIYLSLEKPDAFEYKNTFCYNAKAFRYTVNKLKEKNLPLNITVFTFDNLDYMKSIWDADVSEKVISDVLKYLKTNYPQEDIYYLDDFIFAVFNLRNDDIDKMRTHFLDQYKANDMDVSLIPLFAKIKFEDYTDVESIDVYTMSKNAFKRVLDDDVIALSMKQYISEKKRNKEIISLLKNSEKDDLIKIYYQPIYDVKRKSFHTCEALARIYDNTLGLIDPREFVKVAEKNGLMVGLGEQIIESVCKFYDKAELDNYGIDGVDINLSSVQCMKENLFSDFINIIYGYSLNVNIFNYDINENARGNNDLILKKNMSNLINMGAFFSLDDFSMKVSNDSFLVKMPFNVVKISKEDLWKALSSKEEMTILEDTVAMLKHLNKKIVIEGVETELMYEIALKLDADFIQGYYYSQPLSEDEYLEFLKKHK